MRGICLEKREEIEEDRQIPIQKEGCQRVLRRVCCFV